MKERRRLKVRLAGHWYLVYDATSRRMDDRVFRCGTLERRDGVTLLERWAAKRGYVLENVRDGRIWI